MPNDALAALNAYDNAAYDELLNEAKVDHRVGDHDFLVSQTISDTWESGDPRFKANGTLLTARNAKADLTWSPPPPADVVAAELARAKKNEPGAWEPGKIKAIANSISIAKQCAQHYGIMPNQLREGAVYRVKTVKTRTEKDGTGGFIRIIAFLPPKSANGTAEGEAQPSVGF